MAVLTAGLALAQPAVAADPIILGNTAPYSGPASAYGTIARAEEAYFKMLNDAGGISGRPIEFLSLDDGYSPPKTVEQTRRLVEQDEVLALFSAVGTAPNIAVQKYLNAKHVPQLLVSSGASRWNDPRHFPWTTSFNPTYETEGRVYAQYILKTKPDAKIAVITPNEDAGRDYLKGFKEGLGPHADQIVGEATYLTADPTIDSQIITFQQSGADVFFAEATPKFAAQALRKAADLGWKPLIILPTVSNSVSAVLEPAGLANAAGVVSGAYLKDPGDPRWADDEGMRAWRAWMNQYQPGANPGDILNVSGYTAAQLMALYLERCKAELTGACLVKQAQSLHDEVLPMLLPGIRLNTNPDDVVPIRQLQMMRFDGKSWALTGDVFGD
ncbi:ABC transporter substrate-binding protein [Chelatococcus reniformis]|uniref:ABC transporter substrate-binding protein n=2 Tax=Chelatococcus reniformis TaxID=1494448 RepID=A0A916UP42_9HYPH|nr:ABC transporter substrate-binding protein [Chelatococcus reniformis]